MQIFSVFHYSENVFTVVQKCSIHKRQWEWKIKKVLLGTCSQNNFNLGEENEWKLTVMLIVQIIFFYVKVIGYTLWNEIIIIILSLFNQLRHCDMYFISMCCTKMVMKQSQSISLCDLVSEHDHQLRLWMPVNRLDSPWNCESYLMTPPYTTVPGGSKWAQWIFCLFLPCVNICIVSIVQNKLNLTKLKPDKTINILHVCQKLLQLKSISSFSQEQSGSPLVRQNIWSSGWWAT